MSGYPVSLNGDHAQFEREHANTPPHERPDWPLPSFDARDWAAAFCKIAKEKGHDLDEDWMVTWFANALMRGFDEHAARSVQLVGAMHAALQQIAAGTPDDVPPFRAMPRETMQQIARDAITAAESLR